MVGMADVALIALQIACCIERARLESMDSQAWPASDNEIYWHTREAAAVFGRKLGVPIPQIVSALRGLTLRFSKQKDIYRLSEPYWPDLAHPELVIKEVMAL